MSDFILENYIKLILKEILNEALPAPQQNPNIQQKVFPPQPPPQALGLKQVSGPVTPQIASILFKIFAAKLKEKKGIDVSSLKQIGVGTQGVAYLENNKVLKITGDVREAKTAAILMQKPLPSVITFFDAWQFPSTQFYGIVMEQLQPLPKEDAERLNKAIVNTKFTVFLYKANGDWNEGMKTMARSLMQTYADQAFKQFNTKDIKNQQVQDFIKPKVQQAITDFESMTKEFKLRELFKSLKQLGIEYYDFHAGNYGKRADGSLVLFDLGNGRVNGGEMPPILEKVNISIFE